MSTMFGALFRACLVLALASASASVASASEPTEYNYRWSGFYAGLNAGYGWGDNSYTYTSLPETTDFGTDGVLVGGTVGINWQHGRIVVGLEGDLSYSDISGYKNTSAGPVSTTPCLLPGATEGCSAEVNWLGTLRVRAGLATGKFMPFVTGGLAVGSVEGFADSGACGGPVCEYSDTRFGWTIGGGVEVAIREGWTAKFEYLYVDLGEPKFTAATVQTDRIDFNVIRTGLNYRF